jgi:hypothetical protein
MRATSRFHHQPRFRQCPRMCGSGRYRHKRARGRIGLEFRNSRLAGSFLFRGKLNNSRRLGSHSPGRCGWPNCTSQHFPGF